MRATIAAFMASRRRLRGQLAVSGLTTGTAFWKITHGHEGDPLWIVAAVAGGIAVLGTIDLLDRAARALSTTHDDEETNR